MKRNIRIWFRRMFFVFVVMLWLETGGHQTVKAYGDSGEGLKDQKTVETQPSDTDELSLDETETTEELLKEILQMCRRCWMILWGQTVFP